MHNVTVAICTKNRPIDLLKTITSIKKFTTDQIAELLIVDDGSLDRDTLREIQSNNSHTFNQINYIKKNEINSGLYKSRIIAAQNATQNIITFFDDDIELVDDYFQKMKKNIENGNISGFGGIDIQSLPKTNGIIGEMFANIFLLTSNHPGRLSPTSFNFSQSLWRSQKHSFETEFLHGCNMTFKKSSLLDLPNLPWLYGHSPYEDIVLSWHASKSGRLVIDVDLHVKHNLSPENRDNTYQRIKQKLFSSLYFDFLRHSSNQVYPLYIWSICGLFIKDTFKSIKAFDTQYLKQTLRAYSYFFLSILFTQKNIKAIG